MAKAKRAKTDAVVEPTAKVTRNSKTIYVGLCKYEGMESAFYIGNVLALNAEEATEKLEWLYSKTFPKEIMRPVITPVVSTLTVRA